MTNYNNLNIDKKCKQCGLHKTLNEFGIQSTGKYGVKSTCKKCHSINERIRVLNLKSRSIDDIITPEHKKCPKCGYTKSYIYFTKTKASKDGLDSNCKSCCSKRASEWGKNNKDKVNLNSRNSKRRYPEKRASLESKRRALIYNAIHPSADLLKISNIYKKAKEITKETGIPHQVDHIFPLSKAPNCKIHHEDNLQIIEKSINLIKGNSLEYINPTIIHWRNLPTIILQELPDTISRTTVYDMSKNDTSVYGEYY